jgi:8-oxo-dGTP diphosphatase
MKRLRVVAALLSRPGPLFLAQQRPMGAPRGGLWEFPGGKVEPGERDEDALQREIREELGCEVAVQECLAKTEHAYPDLSLELSLYRCTLNCGEPAAREGQLLRWGTAAELVSLPFAEADLPFLPLLQQWRG